MFKSVTIRNFRGFDELTVDGLTRVNLIVGDNGVGKTSLLEALFLLAGKANPELAFRVDRWRGLPASGELRARQVFRYLFHMFDTDSEAAISAQPGPGDLRIRVIASKEQHVPLGDPENGDRTGSPASDSPLGGEALEMRRMRADDTEDVRTVGFYQSARGAELELGLRIEPPLRHEGPLSVFIHARAGLNANECAKRYSEVRKSGRKGTLVQFLNAIDGRISDLELLEEQGETVLHADIGMGQWVPVGLLGDGAARAASIYLAMDDARGGLLLVDEIDTGLHYSALKDGFWEGIHRAAEDLDVQVFATTHSYECVEAARESFAGEAAEGFSVHRLERVDDRVLCVSFGADTLSNALDLGFEVR